MAKKTRKKKKHNNEGNVKCPNCDGYNTEVVNGEFICHDCKHKTTGIVVFSLLALIGIVLFAASHFFEIV